MTVATGADLGPALGLAFFCRPAAEVAPALIGCLIRCDGVAGRIVEAERYEREDPASHSFRGLTPRVATMFGPPGRLYVYRSYGIHWCVNIVCEAAGAASAVLLRALEPTHGLAEMRARRPGIPDRDLARGPGRLTVALGLTGADDGSPAHGPAGAGQRVTIHAGPPVAVATGPRIGISRATDRPWRYVARDSAFLSRPAGWRPPRRAA